MNVLVELLTDIDGLGVAGDVLELDLDVARPLVWAGQARPTTTHA